VFFGTARSVHVARSSAELPSFDSFIQLYGRSYQQDSAEYHERRALYEKNRDVALLQNGRSDRLWTAGVNKLWDWTDAEFQTLRGWDGSRTSESGGRGARAVRQGQAFLQLSSTVRDLPKEKIWSNLVMAKQVKNQGSCGSCWAIAAATVLEGHYEIYSGKFRTFSAQQIVACTPNPRQCGGKGGCSGATAELAMEWVMKHGLADETAEPYTAGDTGMDGTCTAKNMTQSMQAPGAAAFGMTGWETLPKNKYEPLVLAIATQGPAVVAVSGSAWQQYESGIFNGCSKDAIIDHAVTAIGYGEENGVKYWVIQNSWGADWGEEGHIRLQRHDSDEYCGMNNDPEVGIACKGESAPVPVCGMCGILFDSVVPQFSKSPQLAN